MEIPGSRNTFGVMAEYSNDSSHILMGDAVNVKLGAIGLQYQRRLFANRHLVWSYGMEFRPVIIESNPTLTYTMSRLNRRRFLFGAPEVHISVACQTRSFTNTVTGRCTGPELRPRDHLRARLLAFGMKVNLLSRSRLQPTFSSYEGYIFSTRPVPSSNAGSFNFAFETRRWP